MVANLPHWPKIYISEVKKALNIEIVRFINDLVAAALYFLYYYLIKVVFYQYQQMNFIKYIMGRRAKSQKLQKMQSELLWAWEQDLGRVFW